MSTHDYGSAPEGGDHAPAGRPGEGYGYPPEPGPYGEASASGYGPGYGEYGGQGGYGPGQPYGYDDGTYGQQAADGQTPPQHPAAYGTPAADGTWSGQAPPAAGGWPEAGGQQQWQAAPAGDWEQPGAGGYAYGGPEQQSRPQGQQHSQPQAYGSQPQGGPGQQQGQQHGPGQAYGSPEQPHGQPQSQQYGERYGRPQAYGDQLQPAYGDQLQPPAYGAPAQQPSYQPDGYQAQPPYQPSYQPRTAPHAYADPQPYAPGGLEHTAVLPVIEDADTRQAAEAAPPDPGPQGPVRTGSPIIPPGIQPAGLTAALGLLLAGGAAVGKPGLAVVLVLLQAVTAAGWFRLNGMWPARQGILLAFLGGVTADVALLAVDGGHGPLALAGTLGVWLLLVLVLQLRHHGSPDERLSSLTATSASTLLAVLAACYLATATSQAGTDPVIVGVVAVAAATVIRALRLPGGEPVSLVLALAAATATGLVTGPATGLGGADAALLAVVSGACALIGLRVASYDFPSRFVHFTAGVALPLTAAAPLVYILGRALS
ncbi:hypothetical protein ACFO3J_01615 [Streptomyces polygonati]|uniref:Integral membrane protein n=1 Tax=Streptomyces polygonati TaxID=1617087 RepID=A0ABV8HIQ7_9ACTN